jgi:hypothetical protein
LLGVPRPLVGWQGGKQKYTNAIMRTLGIERAAEVWCADVSPWVPCWTALARPGVAREAADIVEGWWSTVETTADARAVWDVSAEAMQHAPDVWGPRDVAGWFVFIVGSAMNRPGAGPGWRDVREPRVSKAGSAAMVGIQAGTLLSSRLRTIPTTSLPLRAWHGATSIPPTGGALVYIDPPYKGTTGYQPGDIDRDGVLSLVEAWRSAGSVVAVSEAEPLPGGVAVDIGAMVAKQGRRGTLTREWLTVYGQEIRPRRQASLFGGS